MFSCSKYCRITTYKCTLYVLEAHAKLSSVNNFVFGNYARNSYQYISLHFQQCYTCVYVSWFCTHTILFSSWWDAAGNLWHDLMKFLSQVYSLTKLSLLLWKECVLCGSLRANYLSELFLASGHSILLTLSRWTTTISHVSALILLTSQLHLCYNSTDINTLELFSI